MDHDPDKLAALFPLPDFETILDRTKIHSAEIGKCADAFAANIGRLNKLINLPFQAMFTTILQSQAHAEAEYKYTGRIEPLAQLVGDEKRPYDERQQYAIDRFISLVDLCHSLTPDQWHTITTDMIHGSHWQVGRGPDSDMQPLLTSAVVGMWTAFETLAGDLWVAAVNGNPRQLVGLDGRRRRIEKIAVGDTVPNQDKTLAGDEKKFGLQSLQDALADGADLNLCVGDLLRQRFTFTVLAGIREAYSVAFDDYKNTTARQSLLDNSLADSGLDALSAMRNLIVHKSAVADQEYVNKTKNATLAPKLGRGERLVLNGEVVRDLREHLVKCGAGLILATDAWATGREAP